MNETRQNDFDENNTKTIPIIEEVLNVEKKVIDTGKVLVHKTVEKENQTLDIPLKEEEYEVKRVPVKKELLDDRPQASEKDGIMIIPVVREVPQVVIKYEVTEEIHLIRHETERTHHEEITLMKEKADVYREDTSKKNE